MVLTVEVVMNLKQWDWNITLRENEAIVQVFAELYKESLPVKYAVSIMDDTALVRLSITNSSSSALWKQKKINSMKSTPCQVSCYDTAGNKALVFSHLIMHVWPWGQHKNSLINSWGSIHINQASILHFLLNFLY